MAIQITRPQETKHQPAKDEPLETIPQPDAPSAVTHTPTTPAQEAPATPQPTPDSHPVAHKQVFAIVRGDAMDAEVVKMACIFARAKQTQIVAMYGIEVPRKNELEASMPKEEQCAAIALQNATTIAERYDADIETEMVKTRKFSLSVVDEANRCSCSLLVLGVPYQERSDGNAQMDPETDYILEHATCRVVLIRGNKATGQC